MPILPQISKPKKSVFEPKYINMLDAQPQEQEPRDTAMGTDPQSAVKTYGGINLDPQLLDL